jgi:hypothetical protein
MILALAVALGVAGSLARHRGRAPAQIGRISLRSAWLALLALVLQWPMLRAQAGPTEDLAVQQALFLLSHLLLLAFVWRNRRQPGILVVGLGVAGNLLVILANGGLMPITPETLVRINPGTSLESWSLGSHYGYSKDVILARGATRLWFLSDILVLPRPFPWPTAFSLGDLVIAAGIILLLQGPGRSSALPLTEARAL